MAEDVACQSCSSCGHSWADSEPAAGKAVIRNMPRRWSALSYPGETMAPQGIDPAAGSWPLYFLKRDQGGGVSTLRGAPVNFEIQQPENFNFDQELLIVKQTLQNLTPHQKEIAKYWGAGPPTKQWMPIVDRLLDTYGVTPCRATRIIAAVQAGVSDALVVTWFYKYLWDIPRPNQLDQELSTVLPTPRFPTYPAGHSTLPGAAEVILSYFFPPEAQRLHQLAEECSVSRLYAGIHFPCDNSEGLRLGRQIGRIAVDILSRQGQEHHNLVDMPITVNRNAVLPPPPYKQVIPYPPQG